MNINCVAIDDEPLALDIIADYCDNISYLNLQGTYTSPVHAIEFLKSNKVDLLFLDIQMEQLTGIQLLNVIKSKPLVVFTTAYDSFAMMGYELDVVDYLLKPISFERFLKATNKVFEKLQSEKPIAPEHKPSAPENMKHDYFFVKTDSKMQKVNLNDILYVEGQCDYLKIVTEHERIMTLMSFKKMEDILPGEHFFRTHKSYIVALSKIEFVERNRIKIKDQYIPIAEGRAKLFFKAIENHS
ncbi:MAG: LytTR family DNA-binding domain-containing protein [Bacteroidota bacterium]